MREKHGARCLERQNLSSEVIVTIRPCLPRDALSAYCVRPVRSLRRELLVVLRSPGRVVPASLRRPVRAPAL